MSAHYSFNNPSWTTVAVADTTTMTANGACFLQGANATQIQIVNEVYMGGLATSSTPVNMVLARDSTVGVTSITLGTNGKLAALDATTVGAATPIAGFSATTMPQRAATLHLQQLAFNLFGGIVRWVAQSTFAISQVGLSANTGELSLSGFTAGTNGLLASNIVFEVL